ncbi:MAG: exopolysaccharide biosynthesis polyprenyl glycosylphosphotransferase [Clostridiales bacterium]|nr:MAG: exopolysaccharide biosynthesis polyprenyl glycosylphosphotransferase [Clostridiales bacterium]
MSQKKFFAFFYNILVVIVMIISYSVFNYFRFHRYYLSFVLAIIFVSIFYGMLKYLDADRILKSSVGKIIYSIFFVVLITNCIQFLLLLGFFGFENIIKFCVVEFVLDVVILSVITIFMNMIFNKLYIRPLTLLIYGGEGSDLETLINQVEDKMSIYKIYSTVHQNDFYKYIGDRDLTSEKINFLIYNTSYEFNSSIVKFCYENDIDMTLVPSISEILISTGDTSHIIDSPFIDYDFSGLSIFEEFFKRIFDLLVSIPIFIILFPIMILVSISIKLEDGGNIFYRQERLTKNGKKFSVLKFRSMVMDAEKDGARLAVQNDPRITKVGNIIRKLRMDELPQLINIIVGDMSIVGPRPEREVIMKEYLHDFPEFSYRLKVKSGLTGLAQVEGKYNTSPEDKIKLDLIYIRNYSFFFDIKIIIKTLKIIFTEESTEGIVIEK